MIHGHPATPTERTKLERAEKLKNASGRNLEEEVGNSIKHIGKEKT